jgi:hypothetical protein|tara:strand:+ start:2791 stop:3006 length:216 start_codon:yes stop_codon:yes gene_type:complete
MSRIFEEFTERVFAGNPYAREQELASQLNAEHQEWHYERQKWIDGKITLYNGGTVEQWVALGRPSNNNKNL